VNLSRPAKAVLGPVVDRCYDVRVEGLAHVPEGPAVLAANHLSATDAVFLALAAPRPVTFIAKAEYFDRRRTAWFLRATGQIPLRRGNGAAAGRALADAGGVLAHGGLVGVFPEGTRSRDGYLHRGNTGPARLALESGAPVVPVGLVGTDAVLAPDERVPHLFRGVTVRFGPPLQLHRDPTAHDKTTLRLGSDSLMHAIAALSGQTYVDRFAERAIA